MLSSLRPLRRRNFALIWAAALLSNIGSWMQTVAVGVLVTARTGQAGWTGLVAAAAFVPIGLLSPVGGVMADRLDRRAWLAATTAAEATLAGGLTLLAATGHASPGAVTVLVFAGGAAAAVGFPAYQAMLPELVPEEELGAAISLSSAQYNLGRVVGPALAGVAIVAGGYSWAFGINAISFAAVLVALAVVRLPTRVRGSATRVSTRQRLAEGARAVAANRSARFAVGAISTVALTASPFIALVPAVALTALHAGARGTSVLVTAQGIGAVTGALAMTPMSRRLGRRRLVLIDAIAVGAALVLYAAAPDLWLAAAAILLVGAAYIGVLAGCNTVVQLNAPPALRGRMLGIYMMALGLVYPVGAIVQGRIADAVGVRAVTAAGGVALIAAVGLAGWRRLVPESLDGPAPLAPEAVPEPPEVGTPTEVATTSA